MKRSTDRILTTHAGRLDGPTALMELTKEVQAGCLDLGALRPRVRSAIVEVIQAQAQAGIDVVSDGELGKVGFGDIAYYRRRFSGLSTKKVNPGEPQSMALHTGERIEFADFYQAEMA